MQAKPSARLQGNGASAKPPAATTADSYQVNPGGLGNSIHTTFKKPAAQTLTPRANPPATESTSLLGPRQKSQLKSSDAVPETPARHLLDPRGWF